jgi:hypothetical protein
MPFVDRRYSLSIQPPDGSDAKISRLVTKAALLAIEAMVRDKGGTFEIVERREKETIFRISADVTSLTIRQYLSKLGLKPEIKMVFDPK